MFSPTAYSSSESMFKFNKAPVVVNEVIKVPVSDVIKTPTLAKPPSGRKRGASESKPDSGKAGNGSGTVTSGRQKRSKDSANGSNS